MHHYDFITFSRRKGENILKSTFKSVMALILALAMLCPLLASCTDTSDNVNRKTVTFDSMGGSEVEAQQVEAGAKAQKPADPVKDGYTFVGWMYQGELWSFVGYVVTEDMTLTAQWRLNTYSIIYTLEDGANAAANPTSFTVESEAITLNAPTKTGYTFVGWTWAGQTEPQMTVTIPAGTHESKAFTANWQANEYMLTLNANGGAASSAAQTVTYDAAYTLPAPTRTGYTFDGWYDGDTAIENGTWKATADKTLTAHWRANTYTMTFDTNGGTVLPASQTVTYDAIYTLPTPERTGYVFSGWYYNQTLYQGNEAWIVDGAVTLTARWTPVTYTITYYTLQNQDDPGINPATFTIEDDTITLAAPTRTGYTFIGWTWQEQTEPQLSASVPAGTHENQVFTAHWRADVYTVSYALEGGVNAHGNPAAFTIESDDITLAAPIRTGYTFTGWTWQGQTEPQLVVTVPTGTHEHKLFVANWQATVYTVAYTLNGGENAQNNPTAFTIESDVLTLAAPTRTGYDFTGWTWEGQTEPQMMAAIPAGSYGPKTFVAHWQAVFYTVTYLLDDGTNAQSNPAVFTIESEDIVLAEPSRAGCVFIGWTWQGQSEPQLTVTIPAGTHESKTFTANWEIRYRTVTIKDPFGSLNKQTFTAYMGQEIELPNAVAETKYMQFVGWYYGDTKVTSGPWPFDKDLTLTAVYRVTVAQADELPANLDYKENGRAATVNVLTWSDVEKPEFEVDGERDDPRMEAIYNRNKAIEKRLGVKLEFDSIAGDSSHIPTFVSHVETTQQAGTHDFDIIATYSRTAGVLTTKGLLVDVNRIQDTYLTVDTPVHPRTMEQGKTPWWPKYLSENMQMGNKLYMLSGPISCTVIDELHCIYFNKELVNIQFENRAKNEGAASGSSLLFQYVLNGTWTIDKLIEMCGNYWVDTNRTGRLEYGDRVALCSISYCATALYGSCGFKMLEPNPVTILRLSDDITSDRLHSLTTLVGNFMQTNDYFHDSSAGSYIAPFRDGDALFMLHYLESAEDHLIGNDRVAEYGVLPCPKYNQNQPSYYTVVGNAFTVFGIFKGYAKHFGGDEQATLSMLSAVLECWASEGYRKCAYAILEENLGYLKYPSPTREDEVAIVELIVGGVIFDLGRVMESALGDYRIDSQFISACEAGVSWSTKLDTIYGPASACLTNFLENLSVDFAS